MTAGVGVSRGFTSPTSLGTSRLTPKRPDGLTRGSPGTKRKRPGEPGRSSLEAILRKALQRLALERDLDLFLDLVGGLDHDGVRDAFLSRHDVGDEARHVDLGLRDLERGSGLVVGDDDVAGDRILTGGEIAEVDGDRGHGDARTHD